MKVTVKTAGYYGIVTKTISLQSDDPVRPQLTLKVKMAIVGSAMILPGGLLALHVRPEQPTEGRMVIRKDPTETGALHVTGVSSSEDWLQVGVRPVVEEQTLERGIKAAPGDFILEASVPESPGAGQHRAEITFRTGLPREPVITVPVTVIARRFGRSAVKRLLLQRKQADDLMTGRMNFRLMGRTDPEAVKVRITPDRYRVEVAILNPNQLQVLVSEDPDKDNGEPLPEGMLIFTKGSETISVPVRPSG